MSKAVCLDLPSSADIAELRAIAGSLPTNALCVEIGSYLGASALVIARALAPGSRLWCVDTWMNDGMSEGRRDTFAEFRANTRPFGEQIAPLRADSRQAATRFSDRSVDFLFIDGDHSFEGCSADISAWLPKMKPGGIVAFHDVGWAEGVQRAIRTLFFPIQSGPGRFLPNLYWGRIGADAPQPATSPSAFVCVVSSKPEPDAADIARIAPGLGGAAWTWIFAGRDASPALAPRAQTGGRIASADAVGLHAGRHKALQLAREEDVVVYLDDDVTLPEGWLAGMLEAFEDPDVHIAGCRYLPAWEHPPPAWLEAMWIAREDGFRTLGNLSLLDGGEEARDCDPTLVWGLGFAVRRDTAIKLAGFHPDGLPWELRRYRGDGETGLSAKAALLGLRARYQGKTFLHHAVPAERMTLAYLERRAFLQGISDSFTHIRRAGAVPPTPPAGWQDRLRPLKRGLHDRYLKLRAAAGDAGAVKQLAARAHFEGMRFHEAEVRADAALLHWVLRPDFLDCRVSHASTDDPLRRSRVDREPRS